MLRYCDGEVTGRSFLIAGHRGAGKTTMVSNAHLQAVREAGRRIRAARPLIVWLHGPSLFPQDRASLTTSAPSGGDGASNAGPMKVDTGDRQVTVIVHPSVSTGLPDRRGAARRTGETKRYGTRARADHARVAPRRRA